MLEADVTGETIVALTWTRLSLQKEAKTFKNEETG